MQARPLISRRVQILRAGIAIQTACKRSGTASDAAHQRVQLAARPVLRADSERPDITLANQVCTTVGSATVNDNRYIARSLRYSHTHLWHNFGIVVGLCIFLVFCYLAFSQLNSGASSESSVTMIKGCRARRTRSRPPPMRPSMPEGKSQRKREGECRSARCGGLLRLGGAPQNYRREAEKRACMLLGYLCRNIRHTHTHPRDYEGRPCLRTAISPHCSARLLHALSADLQSALVPWPHHTLDEPDCATGSRNEHHR